MSRVSRRIALWSVAIAAFVSAARMAAAGQSAPAAPPAPEQPVSFSHRFHVTDLGMDCADCHATPNRDAPIAMPAIASCQSCHARIAPAQPALQRLAAFAASGKPIPWIRLYQLPDFVYWNHAPHLGAGLACDACHGPVRDRDVLARETDVTTMRGCQRCHETRQILTDCGDCHEPRQ